MRHTISILVENKFGVLTRVAGLFSGRGYNIDSLNVAPTHDATASRMTIVTHGDEATIEQILKQLNKLPDVLKVHDFRNGDYVDRELVLVKVAVDSQTRAEVMQITDIFRAKIVDVQPKSLTIEITGNESKVEKFLELMNTFGVLELTRTGKIALPQKMNFPINNLWQKSTPTRTPISACCKTKRSPCSASARKAMPTRSTSRTAASRSSSASTKAASPFPWPRKKALKWSAPPRPSSRPT